MQHTDFRMGTYHFYRHFKAYPDFMIGQGPLFWGLKEVTLDRNPQDQKDAMK